MGALSGLYGAFGNPTEEDRRRLYDAQSSAQNQGLLGAQGAAQRSAMGAASTAIGQGNPFLAARVGAQAAGDASQRVQTAGISQRAQLSAQQQAQEIAARQREGQFGQQMFGSLLNAGGQVLGMAVPALGALGGASRAVGGAPQGSPLGGLGSLLGGGASPMPQGSTLLGPNGAGIPQAQAPGAAPPGMRWDPMTNQWVPV